MVDFNTTPILQWPVDEQDQFPKSRIELTREEFEKALGFNVFDWQWEWVKGFASGRRPEVQFVHGRRGGRWALIEATKEVKNEERSLRDNDA